MYISSSFKGGIAGLRHCECLWGLFVCLFCWVFITDELPDFIKLVFKVSIMSSAFSIAVEHYPEMTILCYQ